MIYFPSARIILTLLVLLTLSQASPQIFASSKTAPPDKSDHVIRSLEALRELGNSGIESPVELDGTVTYVNSVWKYIFIQDGEHAVFVENVNTAGLKFGDLVSISGVCVAGDVSTVIHAESVIPVGFGNTLIPKHISIASLEKEDADCTYVTLECDVKRAVSSVGHTLLFCEQDGTPFHVVFDGSSILNELWEHVGAKIQIEGVLGVTLESGTENFDVTSPLRRVKSIRVQCSKPPKVLFPGKQERLPPTDDAEVESATGSGVFQLNGQVTHRMQDRFLLTGSPKKRLIEFPRLHGFNISNVVRVGGTYNTDSEGSRTFNALAVESMFSTELPTPLEYQTVNSNFRKWEYVKAIGRPTNVRKELGFIKFDIQKKRQTANIEWKDDGSTSVELLRNTGVVVATGTVMDCEPNGDCLIAVPNSRHVLMLEPIVPVWKYVAWFLFPLTGVLVGSFFWLKNQRNRAAEQSASIKAMHTRLVSAFKAISDGLLAVDDDQKVLSVNSSFCKLIGQPLAPGDTVSSKTFAKFLAQVKNTKTVETRLLNPCTQTLDSIEFEGQSVDTDGQTAAKMFDLTVTAIEGRRLSQSDNADPAKRTPSTVGRLIVLRDISCERQLQAETIRANRIEAVGQLVGGIAHDYNNIQTTITANISMVDSQLEFDETACLRVADAEVAANRGTELVRRLLTYSGKTQLNPAPHSINETIRELYKFSRATFDARYIFDFELDELDPFVHADAGSIEQVLLNLYLNARDAMPDGGVIKTRTRLNTDGEKPVVTICVSDNGRGISAEIEKQIFTPFFTTKAGQAGTGLGLSISRRLITEQNGELNLLRPDNSSCVGRGACFVISLPSTQRPIEDNSPANIKLSQTDVKNSANENEDSRKTVLVVDDEDAIRKVCTLILGNEGFEVVTAINGDNALSFLEENHSNIDAVLLDLTMPGMSGLDVLKVASEKYPDLPVILCSGYLAGASSDHDDIRFKLAKPFSNTQLVNAVSQAMNLETV